MSSDICIKVENLTKEYYSVTGYKLRLFENITFSIKENELTTIVAPEGSGKSTLLKILAGLDNDFNGNIENKTGRKILFIPDKPDSYQWLSVAENIKFFAKNISEKELLKIISDVGLEGYENHFTHPKSTGFRFRISLARAIALKPGIILIDDALKNIDDDFTHREILDLLRTLNFIYNEITFIVALTNLTDAVFLGDKILILGKNPSTVIAEIENKLEAYRKTNVIGDSSFEEMISVCKNKIVQFDNEVLFKIKV